MTILHLQLDIFQIDIFAFDEQNCEKFIYFMFVHKDWR